MSATGIDSARISALMATERQRYRDANPVSARLAVEARAHLPGGVPMHWMSDWGLDFPLFVESAAGARLRDADGHDYADFCLGDTGAMFGHAPEPVAAVLRARAGLGYTAMLPTADAAAVAANLAQRFGLPYWQFATTASDANRFLLRVARAVTGRRKILVFDGCYHGAVDETLVRRDGDGRSVPRPGQLGPAFDCAAHTVVTGFDDADGLDAALAGGDIAVVLAEPALTNTGLVLPQPGFHAHLRAATRRHGTLLALDETHTISAGPGGCTRAWGLAPDFVTLGKPLAGGLPAAAWGMSAPVERALAVCRQPVADGHSGLGTTLSAAALTLAVVRANLEAVMTEAAYARMSALADRLQHGLEACIGRHRLAWCVVRLGARLELVFRPQPPQSAAEARAAAEPALEHLLHLYWLNRGVLVTPFHDMLLLSPAHADADIERLLAVLDTALGALAGDAS